MENQVDSAVTTEETTTVTTTEVDEDITIAEGDEVEVEEEFTDTEANDDGVEVNIKGTDDEDGKEEKPRQSKEKNKGFKERRLAQAKEEAELNVLKEYVGKNPYTNEPIETLRDVKVYKTMKQIEKNGGDPVQDYHKYAGLEEQKAIDDKKTKEDNIKKDIEDFRKAFPDVDLKELSKDKDFVAFSNKLLGKNSLKEVYDAYSSVKNGLQAKAEESAKKEIARKIAKDNTSAGSLATVGDANAPKYTLEQIGKMSTNEIDSHWKDVEASYNYWQKHKK